MISKLSRAVGITLAVFLGAPAAHAAGTSGNIEGRVTDQATGKPMPGITVTVKGPPWRVNVDGEAAEYQLGNTMLTPFHHGYADEPQWVEPRIEALRYAIYERLRWGRCDDAMLDVALLVAALASAASAVPGLTHGGEMLNEIIGELMLCLIASGLAIYGRGYLAQDELPPPVRTQDSAMIRAA